MSRLELINPSYKPPKSKLRFFWDTLYITWWSSSKTKYLVKVNQGTYIHFGRQDKLEWLSVIQSSFIDFKPILTQPHLSFTHSTNPTSVNMTSYPPMNLLNIFISSSHTWVLPT